MKNLRWYLVVSCLIGCGTGAFLPADYPIPPGFETARYHVRPLLAADAVKDYEAVMESVDIIHAALLSGRWPADTFTLEQNRRDLAVKERRAAQRRSFTYTIVTPDEERVLGCIYINKGIGGPDAAVFLWIRRSAQEDGFDAEVEASVRTWIEEKWPFRRVVYPGRQEP
ncbi:GNAT family N-acetyltransferase [bacterium]|nr:GNAT family N-acetyltransferase [candidate division CSSED10-310 bacterium]